MPNQQDAVSDRIRDHAVVTVECDVPVGWSLEEWRAVRGLARELTAEPGPPLWRRLRRASRRSRAAADAR
jgi:hypothetical protein